MDELQRLSETIAETYIRDLRRETGSNTVKYGDVSGEVERDLLASGIFDNVVCAAKDASGVFEKKAHEMMTRMIVLYGREYQLTEHGRMIIENMTRIALTKRQKPVFH